MKRYVLTKDKRIIDTSKNGFWRKEVIEESDNLLDLLEDKDLIECGDEGNVIQYDAIFDEINEYKNVVAIWKRNGDVMRRYEV